MDPVSAAVTAPAQVTEVSVLGSVEVPPAIDAGQALTMDNVIPPALCATYIMCAHVAPLASTSNQLLLTSTSAAAPLLVTGPSFPPRMQGPISMLPGAPIAFSGAPVAPPAPYSAIQSAMARTCNLHVNAVKAAGVTTAASVPGSRRSRKKEQAPRRAGSHIPRDPRPLQGLPLQGSRLVLVLLRLQRNCRKPLLSLRLSLRTRIRNLLR